MGLFSDVKGGISRKKGGVNPLGKFNSFNIKVPSNSKDKDFNGVNKKVKTNMPGAKNIDTPVVKKSPDNENGIKTDKRAAISQDVKMNVDNQVNGGGYRQELDLTNHDIAVSQAALEYVQNQFQQVVEQQASKYEQRLEEYKEALGLYKKCLSVFEDRIAEIGLANESAPKYEQRLNEYDEKIGEYDSRISQYDEKIGEYDSQISEYGEKLDEYGNIIDEYHSQVGNYDKKIGEYDSRINEYDEKIGEYDSRINQYGEKIDEYGNRISQYDEKLDEYGNVIGEYHSHISTYDVKLKNYTEQLSKYEEKLAEYEKKNLSDNETAAKMNKDIEFIKSESEKIKRQVEEIKFEPDEEFINSINNIVNNQDSILKITATLDEKIKDVLKEENDEKQKIASYQFDTLMENIKKTSQNTTQMLYISIGANIITVILLLITLISTLAK